MSDETAKVVIHEVDHAAEQRARLKAEHDKSTASVRAGHVSGLQNELAYLERQPVPNKRRVAEVQAELDRYATKPAERRLETAVPQGSSTPPVTAAAAPAKKAPAKRAPAKKAPAKKAAAKKAPAKKA